MQLHSPELPADYRVVERADPLAINEGGRIGKP
jgi:hypothetical protein